MDNSSDVIAFWKNAGYEKWFSRDDAFDAEFDQRFRGLHFRAARRELEGWMGDAEGAREILQEVLHEGDEQQKVEAQALIAKLG